MPKPSLHPKKTIETVGPTMAGIVHCKFLRSGETITAERYCAEIEVMLQKLMEKQPALVSRRGPILLHDKARPQFQNFLSRNGMNWDTKLRHILHIHRSVLYRLSFFKHLDRLVKEKKSAAKIMSKMSSYVLLIPLVVIFINLECLGYFLVGKSALVVTVVISSNKIASRQSYDLSKF